MAIAAASSASIAYGLYGFKRSTDALADASFRLASGNKQVRSTDDSGTTLAASNLKTDQASLRQGIKNSAAADSALELAGASLTRIADLLDQQRALAVQAADPARSDRERALIDQQSKDIANKIDTIASATSFNGKKLLDGSSSGDDALSVNLGKGKVTFDLGDNRSASLFGGQTPDLSSKSAAEAAIDTIDAAIAQVAKTRGTAAGGRTQIDAAQSSITSAIGGLQSGRNDYENTDIAAESLNYALKLITQKAGTAILAQAEQLGSDLLDLITIKTATLPEKKPAEAAATPTAKPASRSPSTPDVQAANDKAA